MFRVPVHFTALLCSAGSRGVPRRTHRRSACKCNVSSVHENMHLLRGRRTQFFAVICHTFAASNPHSHPQRRYSRLTGTRPATPCNTSHAVINTLAPYSLTHAAFHFQICLTCRYKQRQARGATRRTQATTQRLPTSLRRGAESSGQHSVPRRIHGAAGAVSDSCATCEPWPHPQSAKSMQ